MYVEIENSNKEFIYNYNDILDEYFMQSDESKFNITCCEKSKGEYPTDFVTLTKRDVSLRLWKIIEIWLLVYLIFAIPLWCTRGWCCCCFLCKFCKPLKTIEEAKKYLLSYPPGIFIITDRVIQYDPTEREKEAYEEFEHLIRIL